MTIGKGLVRDGDGILAWQGGRHYSDPGEAVKTWWRGELRIGCAEEIFQNWSSHPCGKTPKHDPDANGRPTKCGTHSASAKAKREAASHARWKEAKAKALRQDAIGKARAEVEPALRRIAEGHNDPRGLAQEVIAALDAARAMGDQK